MSSAIITLIVVGGALFAGYYLLTHPEIISSLKLGATASPAVNTTPAVTSENDATDIGNTPTTPAAISLQTGGNCAGSVYKLTGKRANLTDTGPQGQQIHYASSGKAASSRRLNANNTPFNAIEATIYFQFNGTQCGKPDPEMSIKLWGPTHSNGNCCWCIAVVTASGKVCFGGEGPHPSTTTCQQAAGNVGSLIGKTVGFKAVIYPGNGGAHQEIYLDTAGTGAWKLMGTRDGPCGKDKKSTTVSPNQQVEFRIDCKNVTIKCSSVVEIVPGSKGGSTTAALPLTTPAAPAIKAPAKKPKKANFAYDGQMHYLESQKISTLYSRY